jgi:hypothetical protein
MKITTNDIVDNKSLVGHIILNGIGKHPEVMKAVTRDKEAEVKLTVNGAEIDIQSFMDFWQSQVERAIHEEAMKLVEDKFNDIREKMEDFSNALSNSLDSLL